MGYKVDNTKLTSPVRDIDIKDSIRIGNRSNIKFGGDIEISSDSIDKGKDTQDIL